MEDKKISMIWAISLLIIGVATLILSGTRIVGIQLPDLVTRVLGVVELIALPFLAYASVKKFSKKKK